MASRARSSPATLSTYPYVFLLVAAAFRGLDPALEEASRGLGRTPWQTFREVTLPAVRPAIGAGSLLVALYVLADFGAVSLMQYDALTRAIYLQYRALFDRDPAAVLALVLVALTAIVLLLEGRTRRGTRLPRLARDRRSRRRGSARTLALAALGFCPGSSSDSSSSSRWRCSSAGRSRAVATSSCRGRRRCVRSERRAGGRAAAIAVLPVAFLARPLAATVDGRAGAVGVRLECAPRRRDRALLVVLRRAVREANSEPLALLVFAYVVRFFAQALAGASSALAAVSPRVEEAARGLGRALRSSPA